MRLAHNYCPDKDDEFGRIHCIYCGHSIFSSIAIRCEPEVTPLYPTYVDVRGRPTYQIIREDKGEVLWFDSARKRWLRIDWQNNTKLIIQEYSKRGAIIYVGLCEYAPTHI